MVLFCLLLGWYCRNDHDAGTEPIPLKVLLVGNPNCGKTKLVKRHVENAFDNEAETSDHFEIYNSTVEQAGRKVPIAIYDLPGLEEEVNTNINTYSNADVVIFCFDLCNEASMLDIKDRWIRELQAAKLAKKYEYILIGNKIDDRERQAEQGNSTVSSKEGFAMQAEINAWVYLECSAKTGLGVKKVFEAAALVALRCRDSGNPWRAQINMWNKSVQFSKI